MLEFPSRAAHWFSRRFLRVCAFAGRYLSARRIAKGRPRTMWGITPISSLPLKARCDNALGFPSDSVVFTTYYITRSFTWNLSLLRRAFNAWPAATNAGYRLVLGVALLRYDVFHVFADRGILPPVWRGFGIDPEELAALKAAGKRLYVYGYGADVRTRATTEALGRWNFCVGCDDKGRYCVCDDARGRQQMEQTAASATALVSLGDMLAYMPNARHLAYWPVDTDAINFIGVTHDPEKPLRIAHAPNHPHFKGTQYLEAAIASLQAQGHAIELVRVSGVPNTEVIRLFAAADIVADQFIGGAYGYTALEGLARGKPVLTYVRSVNLVLGAQDCPFLNVTPDTLEAALQWCIMNRARLTAIGRQGRAYVERHHTIAAVAGRFATMYVDTAGFPDRLTQRLATFALRETQRQASVECSDDWHHPWQVIATTGSH